ncbi:hypothetical protein ACLOJK_006881 [Asimina triloba]
MEHGGICGFGLGDRLGGRVPFPLKRDDSLKLFLHLLLPHLPDSFLFRYFSAIESGFWPLEILKVLGMGFRGYEDLKECDANYVGNRTVTPTAVLVTSRMPQRGELSRDQDSLRIHVQDPEDHSVNEWIRVQKIRSTDHVVRSVDVPKGSIQTQHQDPEGHSVEWEKSRSGDQEP